MYYNYFKYLSREELEAGKIYLCVARNFSIGFWNGKTFEYTRRKFNMSFQDVEYHYDDGQLNGTVQPIKEVNAPEKECTMCSKDAFLLDKDKNIWYCLSCYLKNYLVSKEDILDLMT